MLDIVWLIPALPLAGFLIVLVAGKRLGDPAAGWVATLMCAGSFVASAVVYFGLLDEPEEGRQFTQTLFEWVPVGGLRVDVGFLADPLSIAMALYAAWCAFQLRSGGLTGFAIVAALMHLSRFYYIYGTSLTWKSVIMFCAGTAMLGAAVLLQRRQAEGGHA